MHYTFRRSKASSTSMRRVTACLLFALGATSFHAFAAPYSGTPVALPATIEAENFDTGGEGVAYHDLTAANTGGQYRTSEGVDIIASTDAAGGAYVVNNFQTGEWLAYTVNAPASGSYKLALRASNNYASPTAFHIEVDGANATGTIPVPKTGSWSAFQWVTAPSINLSAGQHTIRVVADAQYFNLNQIRIEGGTSSTTIPSSYAGTPYTGTPIPLPRMFEAEDFDKGGQGVAYSDKTASNDGGQYRTSEGVDIIVSSDAAGGRYVVNNFQTGEWMAYTVNVPANGRYDLSIRAANNYASPTAFHIEVDGVNVTGSIAVPRTGSWSSFQWVGKQGVDLTAGKHVLKLVADAEYFNVNQLSVLASTNTGTTTPTTGGGTTTPPGGTGGAATPGEIREPGAISGKGYHLVKNWDFVNGLRSITALQNEFYPYYLQPNGTILTYLSGNNEWQRYRDFTNGNHVFTAEGLTLRAFLKSGYPLASGNIDSGMLQAKWYGQYGYFEARMKVPPGRGLWPAFWFVAHDGRWPPEIDIVEIVNNGTSTTKNSFHFVHPSSTITYSLFDSMNAYTPGFDYKDGYHTFAVEWLPGVIRHYVDDKLVVERNFSWTHSDGSDAGPATLFLNLAVGGTWPGAPAPDALPADLQVQYIRVWQK